MENSQKGFVAPLLIVIIALLVIGGGFYIYKNTNSEKCNKNLPFAEYNNCLNTTAVNENNIEICNKTSTSGAKYSCITNFAKEGENLDACNNLPEFDNQGCIMGIAVKIKDLNLCKTLKSNDYQVSCQTQIQNKNAVESGDEQVCENIVSQSAKDKCYAGVAIKNGDVGICEKAVTVAYNTNCYIQIAKNKNDSRICNLIKNSSDKEFCLKELPLQNLADWKVCETRGFEIKYPSNWKIWQTGNAEFGPSVAVNSCNITSMLSEISPDDRPKSNITLDVWDQKRFGTILNPPKFNSLDDWFAYARPVKPRATEGGYRVSEIFGEKVVWTGSDKEGFTMHVFHNQTLYKINFFNVDSSLASKIISSFRFTE